MAKNKNNTSLGVLYILLGLRAGGDLSAEDEPHRLPQSSENSLDPMPLLSLVAPDDSAHRISVWKHTCVFLSCFVPCLHFGEEISSRIERPVSDKVDQSNDQLVLLSKLKPVSFQLSKLFSLFLSFWTGYSVVKASWAPRVVAEPRSCFVRNKSCPLPQSDKLLFELGDLLNELIGEAQICSELSEPHAFSQRRDRHNDDHEVYYKIDISLGQYV